MKILVLNGPNINMLGIREKAVYGEESYADLRGRIDRFANERGVHVEMYQSNSEGALIDKIQTSRQDADAIVINAGAYTHYSRAIYDALRAVELPAVEVHISNIYQREEWRHVSVIAPACIGQIAGLGMDGYEFALDYLTRYLQRVGAPTVTKVFDEQESYLFNGGIGG